ncbi:MAG: hypothetical protein JXA13_16615 [Anaerolineales bacterium]|nr:hypothetical protein [Anaerolineales bacterium]
MIDFGKILKRAWRLVWNYRALWVFGIILALTVGGGGGNSGSSSNRSDSKIQSDYEWGEIETFEDFQREFGNAWDEGMDDITAELGVSRADLAALFWTIIALIGLMFLIGLGMTVLRYMAETSLIRMVDDHERTGEKVSVSQGFRYGWSRTSWRLFLIDLIVSIPGWIILVWIIALSWWLFSTLVIRQATLSPAAIVFAIGGTLSVFFFMVVLSIVLYFLRIFFWRVCVLENAGVGQSFRGGFALARKQWQSALLMWLIMIGINILWVFAGFILFFVLLIPSAFTAIAGVIAASIPTLIVAGISSLYLGGWLPWIAGAVAGAPLLCVIAFAPFILVEAWMMVYRSSVWTLAYREMKALDSLDPQLTAGNIKTAAG